MATFKALFDGSGFNTADISIESSTIDRYAIFWGDGTKDIVNGTPDGSGDIIAAIAHTYAASGDYAIHIKERPDDPAVQQTKLLVFAHSDSAGGTFGETIHGFGTSDLILTGSGNDLIVAAGGDDWINAGGGDDKIRGDDGNDTIFSGDGNDLVSGGNGNDVIDGGPGADIIFGGAGNDTIRNGYLVYGEDGNDILFGSSGDARLDGGAGDDIIHGGSGRKAIFGGDGDDTIDAEQTTGRIEGGKGNDHITTGTGGSQAFGGDGNDVMQGRDGNDGLDGGKGNDWLDGGGGAGRDRLNGGAGADTFHFTAPAGAEAAGLVHITDFSSSNTPGGDGDVIDLSDFAAAAGVAALTFDGAGAFTGHAGEVRYRVLGNTLVAIDVDGDKQADYRFVVDGHHTLQANDFLLS